MPKLSDKGKTEYLTDGYGIWVLVATITVGVIFINNLEWLK